MVQEYESSAFEAHDKQEYGKVQSTLLVLVHRITSDETIERCLLNITCVHLYTLFLHTQERLAIQAGVTLKLFRFVCSSPK